MLLGASWQDRLVAKNEVASAVDIANMQATLRNFGAARGWQPFHTPKNLATALMVEAAELAEFCQWMTPEESRETHLDAVSKQRIGGAVADVLLYLCRWRTTQIGRAHV